MAKNSLKVPLFWHTLIELSHSQVSHNTSFSQKVLDCFGPIFRNDIVYSLWTLLDANLKFKINLITNSKVSFKLKSFLVWRHFCVSLLPETGNGQRPDVGLSRTRIHLQTDGRNEEEDSIGNHLDDVTGNTSMTSWE